MSQLPDTLYTREVSEYPRKREPGASDLPVMLGMFAEVAPMQARQGDADRFVDQVASSNLEAQVQGENVLHVRDREYKTVTSFREAGPHDIHERWIGKVLKHLKTADDIEALVLEGQVPDICLDVGREGPIDIDREDVDPQEPQIVREDTLPDANLQDRLRLHFERQVSAYPLIAEGLEARVRVPVMFLRPHLHSCSCRVREHAHRASV